MYCKNKWTPQTTTPKSDNKTQITDLQYAFYFQELCNFFFCTFFNTLEKSLTVPQGKHSDYQRVHPQNPVYCSRYTTWHWACINLILLSAIICLFIVIVMNNSDVQNIHLYELQSPWIQWKVWHFSMSMQLPENFYAMGVCVCWGGGGESELCM